MKELTGGCQCGALRIVAKGPPDRVGVCHCRDCRKHHGAVFYAAAIFAQAAVTIDGEWAEYKGRCFCPRCGSSVFAQSGTETEVHLGALDDDSGLVPSYECWTARRAAWVPEFSLMQNFPHDR